MPRIPGNDRDKSTLTRQTQGVTVAGKTSPSKGARRVDMLEAAPRSVARKDIVTWFTGGRSRKREYAEVFKADPMVRIDMIKKGVPAAYVVKLANDLHVTQEQLTRSLGLPFSTISRKVKSQQNLTTDQAERVVGLSKLVGQVQTMVEQSGDPAGFDAAEWVGKWIARPNPALGGRRPADFMDTAEGQEIVGGLLAKMVSGAAA